MLVVGRVYTFSQRIALRSMARSDCLTLFINTILKYDFIIAFMICISDPQSRGYFVFIFKTNKSSRSYRMRNGYKLAENQYNRHNYKQVISDLMSNGSVLT